MKSSIPQEKISHRIDQGQFEEAAQDLLEALGDFDFQDALTIEFGEKKLAAVTIRGAVSYLPRLTDGPIITTNFDHVLEKTFADSGARFEPIIWGPTRAQILQKAVSQNKRCLIKLHGDVEDDSDRVLTLNQYERAYGVGGTSAQIDFNKPLPHLLQQLLTSRPVLFLGCSLRNDRIVKFIKQLGAPTLRPPHYAVVERPGDEDFDRVNRNFSSYGIRRIWYPKSEHGYVERILEYLCNAISNQPLNTTVSAMTKTVVIGMEASEAFEALIIKHTEIDKFTVVRYRDKRRLPERTTAQSAADPSKFLEQATIHDNEADQVEYVPRAVLGPELWKRLFDLPTGFVLAVSSRLKLKNGSVAHLPMIDFKCAPTAQNFDLAKDAFAKIGQTDGFLLNSGNSFHYYGQALMNEDEWRDFLGHCLLLADFIDTRYVGHALINNECRLRLSTAPLNPYVPRVVKVF